MFGNTINYLKNKLFNAKETIEDIEEITPVEDIPNEILLQEVDYSTVPEAEIVNPNGEKSLLIVDDQDIISVLYRNDFLKIKQELNKNIEQDCKVIRCLDKDSGLTAFKLVYIDKVKIDFALLDLTLGCMAKLGNNQYAEVDGADLGIYIKKLNPDAKILFVTAHTMNIDNYVVGKYADKLKAHGIDLFNLYLSKNSLERYIKIHDLVYES